MAAIREIADKLDGKPVQMLDRREVPVTEMTDAELFAIAAGGLPERKEYCSAPSSRTEVHTLAIDLFSKTALKNASCTNRITAD